MLFDRIFGRLYDFAAHNRGLTLTLVAVLALASIVGLFGIEYSSDIEVMLPADELVANSLQFFRDSSVSNKAVVSLSAKEPAEKALLFETAAALAERIRQRPDLFSDVIIGVSQEGMLRRFDSMVASLPFVIRPAELGALIDPRLAREEVADRLKRGYMSMMQPGAVMMGNMLRTDPLGLNMIMLEKYSALAAATGYDVGIEDGHFISQDGAHTLIIASTLVQPTDSAGARRMMAALDTAIAQSVPEGIGADVVAGHRHTVSNEDVIKRDIKVTMIVATVFFVLLFVVFLGDLASMLIFAIPMFGVLVSLWVTHAITGVLSYSVIGLASVVAGISIDYGIHVYIGSRKSADRAAAVKHMAKPVTFGAFTTVGMFGAFFFSHIEGYHQMAVFSISSVLVSLLLALIVLPQLLRARFEFEGARARALEIADGAGASSRTIGIAWIALTVALAWAGFGVGFNPDVKALDGSDGRVLASEERFHSAWGERRMAALVGKATGYEDALELNEALYDAAAGAIGPERVSSIATVWPSRRTRIANLEAWTEFWADGRDDELRDNLAREGRRYGYSAEAFDPFFEHLYPNISNAEANLFGVSKDGVPELDLAERYIQKSGNDYRVAVYFPDEPADFIKTEQAARGVPGAYIVSGMAMSERISDVVLSDMLRMTKAAALMVLLLTIVCFRDLRTVAASLVPVITGVVWLLGGVRLLGLEMNVANMIAVIVVIGLCVDYGIFMSYRHLYGGDSGTSLSVTLSAATTLAGAAALLFAHHPALFSVGVTLVIGVGSGYLSALFVVPWACDALKAGRPR